VAILESQAVDRQTRKGLGEADVTIDRYKKWSEREYSKAQRLVAIIFGGIFFWIIVPDPAYSPTGRDLRSTCRQERCEHGKD
jgi:hypothetical protein